VRALLQLGMTTHAGTHMLSRSSFILWCQMGVFQYVVIKLACTIATLAMQVALA
jgi:hypothetical protein